MDDYLKDKIHILWTIVQVDIQGKKSYEAEKGYMDLSRKTTIQPEDQFITSSITKVFTAVLVLQFIEEGKVKLNSPLVDYLSPEWAAMLDTEGHLLDSFGGHGDGPLFEYPIDLYVTSEYIHVLDMGNKGDKIKTYDKKGKYMKTSNIEPGISPRTFINDDQYIAVISGSDHPSSRAHLEAERPPPSLVAPQELLMAAEERGKSLTLSFQVGFCYFWMLAGGNRGKLQEIYRKHKKRIPIK